MHFSDMAVDNLDLSPHLKALMCILQSYAALHIWQVYSSLVNMRILPVFGAYEMKGSSWPKASILSVRYRKLKLNNQINRISQKTANQHI